MGECLPWSTSLVLRGISRPQLSSLLLSFMEEGTEDLWILIEAVWDNGDIVGFEVRGQGLSPCSGMYTSVTLGK